MVGTTEKKPKPSRIISENLNPVNLAISMPKMRGTNGVDVLSYFKPLITRQIL